GEGSVTPPRRPHPGKLGATSFFLNLKFYSIFSKNCGFQRQGLWSLITLRAAAKRFGAQPPKAALGAEIERNTLSCEARFSGELPCRLKGGGGLLQVKKPPAQTVDPKTNMTQKSIDAAARQYFSKFHVVPLQQRGHVFMRWYCFRYISRCRQPS
ncbi:hypothetical protein C814_03085, partial [Anaerotruncus sp. G3(2012)]